VVDEDDFLSPEQPLGDDQAAQRILRCHAAGVANDVGVPLLQAECLGRVEPGIHTGEHGQLLGRRQREMPLVEPGGVAGVVGEQV